MMRQVSTELLGEDPAESGIERRKGWERSYRNRLLMTDVFIIAAVFVVAHLLKFGFHASFANLGTVRVNYAIVAIVLAAIWFIMLSVLRSRDERVIGAGPEEYQIVVRASATLFGVLGVLTLLFQWEMLRGHLAIVFSLGPLALLLGRKARRTWLYKRRAEVSYDSQVLVVGGVRSGRAMA